MTGFFHFLSSVKTHILQSVDTIFFSGQKRIWDETLRPSIWKDITSPGRLSNQDIDFYRNALKGKDIKRLLILVATPELRELAAELAVPEVHIADFSENMIDGMTEYLTRENAKEKKIVSNWLYIPYRQFFDAVVGDLVLRQIPLLFQNVFLNRIQSVLKPNSSFIMRVQFSDERLKTMRLADIVNEVLGSYKDKKLIKSALRSRLYQRWHSNRFSSVVFDYQKAKQEVAIMKETWGIDISNELVKHAPVTFAFYQTWSIEKESDIMYRLLSFFRIEKVQTSRDYLDGSFFPVITLSKNDSERLE